MCVCGCFALCACAVMLQAEFYVPLKFAEAAILALQPVAGSMSGWQPSDEWVDEPDRLQGTVIGTEMRLVRGTGEACWLSPFRDDSLALHFSFSRQDHAAALAACSEIQQCLGASCPDIIIMLSIRQAFLLRARDISSSSKQ